MCCQGRVCKIHRVKEALCESWLKLINSLALNVWYLCFILDNRSSKLLGKAVKCAAVWHIGFICSYRWMQSFKKDSILSVSWRLDLFWWVFKWLLTPVVSMEKNRKEVTNLRKQANRFRQDAQRTPFVK